MTTRVSEHIALMLKSAGYQELCTHYYNKSGLQENWASSGSSTDVDIPVYYEELLDNFNDPSVLGRVSAPTIADVVVWLYKEHGIWIEAPFWDSKFRSKIIHTIREEVLRGIGFESYDSPTEAYEAAIEYVLLNQLT